MRLIAEKAGLNILVTTFSYLPNRDGIAEASAVLANGLATRGHTVTVATGHHPNRPLNCTSSNPKVEQFKVSGKANLRVGIRGEWREYQQFLLNFQCDVMVFECWDVWSTHLALPIFKTIKAKKVLVSHGYSTHIWVPYHKPIWGLGPWLGGLPLVLAMPFVMRKFDHVVFLSPSIRWNRFLDHWVAKATQFKRCSVISNGAFAHEFATSASDFRITQGIGSGPLLLSVGKYCAGKNQAMAIRAFRRARLENATLVLIGNEFNDYSTALKELDCKLQQSFPAGRVLLLEKLDREMTCAAFRAADLFVLSSKGETQPIVLLEAMASHTPFLSTDVGCVAELPGGVVVQSEQQLSAEMKALIASPDRRRQLVAEGWAACQKTYDWEQVVAAYDSLLRRLTAGNQSTALLPSKHLTAKHE